MYRFLLFLIVLLFTSTANCQTNIEAIRDKLSIEDSGFSGSMKFNMTTRLGQQDGVIFGSNVIAGYKYNNFLFLNYSDVNFVKIDSEVSVEDALTHLRINYYFTDKFAWESFGQYQGNSFNDLKKRFILGLGPRWSFDFDPVIVAVGTSFMEEFNTTDMEYRDYRWNNYLSIYYNKDPIQLSSTSYLQPLFNDFSNYRFSNLTAFNFIYKYFVFGINVSARFERAYYFESTRNVQVEVKNTLGFKL